MIVYCQMTLCVCVFACVMIVVCRHDVPGALHMKCTQQCGTVPAWHNSFRKVSIENVLVDHCFCPYCDLPTDVVSCLCFLTLL